MQDGQFLAACDLKKLVWYVNKGLGQWEPGHGKDSTQPTIRLKFQHRTTDKETGDGFYNEVKANECVGCGEAGHYLKYKCVLLIPHALAHIIVDRVQPQPML